MKTFTAEGVNTSWSHDHPTPITSILLLDFFYPTLAENEAADAEPAACG